MNAIWPITVGYKDRFVQLSPLRQKFVETSKASCQEPVLDLSVALLALRRNLRAHQQVAIASSRKADIILAEASIATIDGLFDKLQKEDSRFEENCLKMALEYFQRGLKASTNEEDLESDIEILGEAENNDSLNSWIEAIVKYLVNLEGPMDLSHHTSSPSWHEFNNHADKLGLPNLELKNVTKYGVDSLGPYEVTESTSDYKIESILEQYLERVMEILQNSPKLIQGIFKPE